MKMAAHEIAQIQAWNQVNWSGQLMPGRCIHEQVSEQAALSAEQEAVCAWDGTWSYRELDERSAELARRLRQAGVGPEVLVPTLFEKSKWAVLAMLAVLKAGGAFVPLDPGHPVTRLRQLTASTGTRVVLASARHADLLAGQGGVPILVVAEESPDEPRTTTTEKANEAPRACSPDNAAYVLFTSGSTGQPKGCLVEHAAFCAGAAAHGAVMGLGPGRRVLQFSSYMFDASLCEIWTSLMMGATVCVPSDEERLDNVGQTMRRYRVDWAFMTPTVLHRVLRPDAVPQLRTLVIGGESPPDGLIAEWAARFELIQVYGPSETVVYATANWCSPTSTARNVGRGLGVRCWVVKIGGEEQLCGINEAGELLLETPAMARGYLKDEARTAESFVATPGWLRPLVQSARLYKTGDLVMWRPDGTIEYVARLDNQIKLRGQRMELGEVEHAVRNIAGVDEVVVLVNRQKIVAVLSLKELESDAATAGLQPDQEDEDLQLEMEDGGPWRERMQEVKRETGDKLPRYMVPTTWLVVKRLPVGVASGKLARQHVQAWVASLGEDKLTQVRAISVGTTATTTTIATAPSSCSSSTTATDDDGSATARGSSEEEETRNAETLLQRLCGEALNIEGPRVQLESPFVQLGGDSLSAMRLVALCRAHGMSLTVRQVLQPAPLRELARKAGLAAVATGDSKKRQVVSSPSADTTVTTACRAASELSQLSEGDRARLRKENIDIDALEDAYSCTVTQEGMLLSQIRDPGLYMVEVTATLEGTAAAKGTATATQGPEPDAARLQAAWEAVVRRHAALRTGFLQAGLGGRGAFTQLVFRDSASLGAQAPRCWLTPQVDGVRGGSTLRIRVNHVAVDASSMGLILRDLSWAYDDRLSEAPAPGRFRDYVDRRAQQSQAAAEAEGYWTRYAQGAVPCLMPTKAMGLGTTTTTSTTRTTGPPTTVADKDYVVCPVDVPSTGALQDFSRRHGTTTAQVLHAAWAIVLGAYLGQDEVLFGYYASDGNGEGEGEGEGKGEGEGEAVGVFLQTLLCRVPIAELPTLGALLDFVRSDGIEGVALQHGCSLARLQHEQGVQALFNTAVSVQDDWGSTWEGRDTRLHHATLHETHDLAMVVNAIQRVEGGSRRKLDLTVSFSRAVADDALVQSVVGTFGHVVKQLVGDGEAADGDHDRNHDHRLTQRLADLSMVSSRELAQLQAWNGPALPAVEACAHELIGSRARSVPNALAVSAWDGDMTYGELEAASDTLARHLVVELGLHVGECVPFCLDKSRWVPVALLGVLKAGGAFVPLEPSHPDDRLGYVTTATQARVAIASPGHAARLRDKVGAVLSLDDTAFAAMVRRQHDQPAVAGAVAVLPVAVAPHDRAAVLFTSGSSGGPKGCVWSHTAWCSSATRQIKGLHMQGAQRVLQFASYSYGASIIELLTTLQMGSTVCIIPDAAKAGGATAVEAAIASAKVDFAVLPPSLLRQLEGDGLAGLRTIACGGEPLTQETADRWSARVRLVVGYGSTEGAVVTCSKHMTPGTPARCFGRPFNGRCWIVNPDNHRQLLPPGAIGELLIEGPHLADGYLHQPEKTTAAFIDDAPWWLPQLHPGASGRMYRTGDLVVLDPASGDLLYVGRADAQVKINGMRIELGEIESQLATLLVADGHHHHCEGSAVELVPATEQGAAGMLVAFVALGADAFEGPDPLTVGAGQTIPAFAQGTWNRLAEVLQESGLGRKLVQKLPRYMIPTCFVPLPRLPLTASAKVDRQRLRALGWRLREAKLPLPTARAVPDKNTGSTNGSSTNGSMTSQRPEPTTPQTQTPLRSDTQRQIAALWEQVLQVQDVGPDDDFFVLGGDSLAAMVLGTRGHAAGLVIGVADVFAHPKLSDLAAVVDAAGAVAASREDEKLGRKDAGRIAKDVKKDIKKVVKEKEHVKEGVKKDGTGTDIIKQDKKKENVKRTKPPRAPLPWSLLGPDVDVADEAARAARQCGVSVLAVQDLYPCTPLQLGMLAMSAQRQGSHVAHLVLDIPDNWDEQRFARAAAVVVRQNAILRTRFVEGTGNRIWQAVLDEGPRIERTDNLDEYIRAVKQTTVGLGEPLTRFVVATMSRRLLWSVHHALYDGWSLPLMLDDLNQAFRPVPDPAAAAGVPPPLPARPPFSAFVNAATLLHSDDEAAADFWRQYMREGPESVPFPQLPHHGFPSAPSDSLPLERASLLSSSSSSSSSSPSPLLRAGVTLSTALRAAWGLTCCDYAGATSAVFGATLGGRDTPMAGIEAVIGPTIATVPVRVHRPAADANVAVFLRELQAQTAVAIPFQHYGLQNVARLSARARRGCDFTSLLIIHPNTAAVEEEGPADPTKFVMRHGDSTDLGVFSTYAMIVQIHLGAGGRAYVRECDYDPRVLDAAYTASVMAHFDHLVGQLMRDPLKTTIRDLATLSNKDLGLIRAWHGAPAPEMRACVHELIHEQAQRQPEAEAVCAWDGRLSRAQLDARSAGLARRLAALGVGRGDRVLVCVDKSSWQIVALLAVLSAGAAFVPIDPSHPAATVQRICGLAQAPAALVSPSHRHLFPGVPHAVELSDDYTNDDDDDDASSRKTRTKTKIRLPQVDPSDAAYVLFTSGTTGAPKGCIVS